MNQKESEEWEDPGPVSKLPSFFFTDFRKWIPVSFKIDNSYWFFSEMNNGWKETNDIGQETAIGINRVFTEFLKWIDWKFRKVQLFSLS